MTKDNEIPNRGSVGCIQGVGRMWDKCRGKGKIYYVAEPSHLGRVYHAYFVPDDLSGDAYALNQADNGYYDYPKLTVNEVKQHGFEIPKNVSTSKLLGLIQVNW